MIKNSVFSKTLEVVYTVITAQTHTDTASLFPILVIYFDINGDITNNLIRNSLNIDAVAPPVDKTFLRGFVNNKDLLLTLRGIFLEFHHKEQLFARGSFIYVESEKWTCGPPAGGDPTGFKKESDYV